MNLNRQFERAWVRTPQASSFCIFLPSLQVTGLSDCRGKHYYDFGGSEAWFGASENWTTSGHSNNTRTSKQQDFALFYLRYKSQGHRLTEEGGNTILTYAKPDLVSLRSRWWARVAIRSNRLGIIVLPCPTFPKSYRTTGLKGGEEFSFLFKWSLAIDAGEFRHQASKSSGKTRIPAYDDTVATHVTVVLFISSSENVTFIWCKFVSGLESISSINKECGRALDH